MFQEQIADITATHLRNHIGDYLSDIAAEFSGSDRVTLAVPSVDKTSMVGGVFESELEKLPRIGVDCINKSVLPSSENLYYCQYDGAIVGLVAADSAENVDKLVKRHARAMEFYVREHTLLHQPPDDRFTLREFIYNSSSFSGAMAVEDDKPLWIAGFTIEVFWVTSEDQPRQHR